MARIVYVVGAVIWVFCHTTQASAIHKRQAIGQNGSPDDLEERYGDFGFDGFSNVNQRPGRQGGFGQNGQNGGFVQNGQNGGIGQNGQNGFIQSGQNGFGQPNINLEEIFGPSGQNQLGQNGQTGFVQNAQNGLGQNGFGQNAQNGQTGQTGQTGLGQTGQTGLGQNGQQQNQSSEAAIAACTRTCLATSEYNPVCGSDGRTHQNEGRFQCANRCRGGTLTIVRVGQCPATTTNAPGTRR